MPSGSGERRRLAWDLSRPSRVVPVGCFRLSDPAKRRLCELDGSGFHPVPCFLKLLCVTSLTTLSNSAVPEQLQFIPQVMGQ